MSSKPKPVIPKGKKPVKASVSVAAAAASPKSASAAAHVASPKSGSAAARRSPSPKSRSAAAHRSPSSTSTSAPAHIASIATVTSLLARPGLDAYANVNEEALAKELAEYANLEEEFVSSASASAAARPPKTVKESLKSLAKTSKEVASLTAAATRSPSPKHFEKIAASLAASTAIAADLTLIASIKAQLKSESKLGRMILEELEPYPISVQCHYIKMFLSDLYATLKEPASTSLHKYIIGPKALPCTTKITEKQFLAYLIDIIGLPSAVGEKARGILFNKDLFNTSTIKEDLYGNSIPHLIDYYHLKWVQFRKTKGGSRSKTVSRKKKRMNRTKKI